MTENTKQSTESQLPEAKASATITVKTPAGFETLITIRDYEDKELTKKQLSYLLNLDKTLIELKFTPVVRGYGAKEKKPIEYVEDRVCPKDGAKIVVGTGKVKERCEHYKYDFTAKKNVGECDYIVWS